MSCSEVIINGQIDVQNLMVDNSQLCSFRYSLGYIITVD